MSAKELRFYSRLQIAAHTLKKRSDRQLLDVAGVTTAQISALAIVASETAATQSMLANQLGLNGSAVTPMVRRLIDMDMLRRVRDESDGRAWLLELTPAGRETLDKAALITDQTSDAVDRLLGKKTIATVVAAMELIINDLD
jgi:DNA-binding MarR family transcriptional regulator|tara:strand:- start:26123 stop:26548 length:426 start_codon:yes stop_codon:yes gene_type:complete